MMGHIIHWHAKKKAWTFNVKTINIKLVLFYCIITFYKFIIYHNILLTLTTLAGITLPDFWDLYSLPAAFAIFAAFFAQFFGSADLFLPCLDLGYLPFPVPRLELKMLKIIIIKSTF